MKKFIFSIISLIVLPAALQAEVIQLQFDNKVAGNMVQIQIPAPLETTRAQLSGVRGELKIDLNDPMKTTGVIEADLSGIQSHSFTDPEKNKTQTEHMHNWFEIGQDVKPEMREKNRWVQFKINKITKVEPAKVASATSFTDEVGTGKNFKVTAEGDLTVHGITKPKTVDLDLTLYDVKPGGTHYQEAQRVLILRTHSPLLVSLKEHDVKPRDTTGKFLANALQVVGLKLSDEAQVSLDLRPYQPKGIPSNKQ